MASVDSAPGRDVAKNVGVGINLAFTPASPVLTDKIAFVQVLLPIVLFPNETGRESPVFGQNDDGTAAAPGRRRRRP